MTVKEFKEKLNQFDDHLIVMIADNMSEWGYFPARNVSQGINEFDGCLFIDDYEEDD